MLSKSFWPTLACFIFMSVHALASTGGEGSSSFVDSISAQPSCETVVGGGLQSFIELRGLDRIGHNQVQLLKAGTSIRLGNMAYPILEITRGKKSRMTTLDSAVPTENLTSRWREKVDRAKIDHPDFELVGIVAYAGIALGQIANMTMMLAAIGDASFYSYENHVAVGVTATLGLAPLFAGVHYTLQAYKALTSPTYRIWLGPPTPIPADRARIYQGMILF